MSNIPKLILIGLLLLHFELATVPAQERGPTEKPASSSSTEAQTDPLLKLLLNKGVITSAEVDSILSAGDAAAQRDRLALLLRNKGVITGDEFKSLQPANDVAQATNVATTVAASASEQPQPTPEIVNVKPSAPPVIAAITPVRMLPIDMPKREGLIPDIKLGSGARLKPYGYFKTSVIHDSSSPQGNEFPLPLLAADTGPNNSPEFRVRARAFRLGVNFEWLDPAPKTVITGRFEMDFEGDFTRVSNRNIASIRSSQASIRLAWARIDRRVNDRFSWFALFGQDWTPFVSSTLPNTIENTNFGGAGYGGSYERAPQVRTGFNYKLGGSRNWKFQPEFAIVLPAFGNLPLNVADQLGFGEREGVDGNQPSLQGRTVLQWQFDRAEGVAPAELIFSFEHARRKAIVTAASVPAAFSAAFPNGAEANSDSNGFSAEVQLPTRYVTLVGKYYAGSDLRFYFSGQLLSTFNDTAGLTATASAPSIDGSSTVVFGLSNGVPTIAPQRPVRAQGGFFQVGFPLSRLFDANPKGRNAGWTAFVFYAYDEAFQRDARRFSPVRGRSDLFSGNIQYKLNDWITFAYEQGYYRTRAANRSVVDFGGLPLFRGIPSYTTHNIRSEFATIFVF